MGSSPPSDPKNEETRIDLGDDLLEATRTIARSAARVEVARDSSVPLSPEKASEEELQSAQILMGEALWDQAKQALHRSLRHHPSNRVARKLLDEVQNRELQALLSRPAQSFVEEPVEGEDADEVLRRLEEDWKIGMDSPSSGLGRMSLLASEEAQRELSRSIALQAGGLPARDRMDLAVGFLQMEMPEAALSLLPASASQDGAYSAIRCWALLQAGKGFDCAAELERLLREENIGETARREMEYLLARAREQLGDIELAAQLYALLGEYRDSRARSGRLRSRKERS